jgi:RNA-binding protein
MTITGEQRRSLAAQAQSLKPLVQIGKNGVTPEQIETIKRDLDQHELVKIKFNDYKSQKQQLSTQIAESTGSEQVTLIGNTLTLYKRKPDPAKRKIPL